jgi:predicted dithiol-disulfide oxidoreductase (DUF899 family)
MMDTPPVVSAQEWEAARQRLLVQEKELTRARDAMAARRRRMPRLLVDKKYEFEGPAGTMSLLDLFDGRRQLVIYRAFFEPGVIGWPDHACHGCSMMADQVAHTVHLNARDTSFAYASRAPQPDIERLKARMGWSWPWYTITSDWDADFGVDQWHGTNAFVRDGDQVFRTYFTDNRGDEALGSTWSYLDLTAFGRQETWEDSPEATRRARRTTGGTGTTSTTTRRWRRARCAAPPDASWSRPHPRRGAAGRGIACARPRPAGRAAGRRGAAPQVPPRRRFARPPR